MAKFRTPKLKRLPTRPKTNASLDAWTNYEKKVADIQKENRNKIKNYETQVKNHNNMIKKRKSLIEKLRGAKNV